MKAISLWQPWASAIAVELKRNETRSWKTAHRGPLAIHAAKTAGADLARVFADFMISRPIIADSFTEAGLTRFDRLPRGCIVAVCEIWDCVPASWFRLGIQPLSETERVLGDYGKGRWAWRLHKVQMIEPVPFRGRQQLFDVPDDLVLEQLSNAPDERGGANKKD